MLRLFVVLRVRRIVPVLILIVLFLTTALALRHLVLSEFPNTPAAAPIVPVFRPDEPAPTFTLTGLDGSEWTETSFQERPFVLIFWATWCDECSDVISRVNRVHGSGRFDNRVYVAAVNVSDAPGAVGVAAAMDDWAGPVLLDSDGRVALSFGIGHMPGIVIVDEYGIIRERLFGKISEDGYEARLQSVVPAADDGQTDG